MTSCRATNASRLLAAARIAIAAGVLSLAGAGTASASIGASFMDVPGVDGGWQGETYKNWVKIEANYWKGDGAGIFGGRKVDGNFRRERQFFSGPVAPREGASTLMISIDKHNPALPKLMEQCAKKTTIPALTYAESSDLARGLRELGPRPADIPAYFEYKLKDVRFSDCPVVAGAPEQAIVVTFKNIEWLNYHGEGDGEKLTLQPADIEPLKSSGETKAFVVSWISIADEAGSDQCAALNGRPAPEEFYALMSKKDADKERAKLADSGGANYENGQMGLRGPHKFNACLLPGILRDPGHVAPQSRVAHGLNLDGDDGAADAPSGTCKHKNYLSEDGRAGIDNQLFTVLGCVAGFQGHKGFLMQYSNEQRRNGLLSMLVEISGIDNGQNDDSVEVSLLYSLDPMAKNASGSEILPDYTFRITDDPRYTHYFARLHGRIVNGVVATDTVKQVQLNLGIDALVTFTDAAMRLQIMPDGNLKAVIGGYQDWHRIMQINATSNSEFHYGFQCPGLYNAFKRAADGMKDPVTGACDEISSAYDIEGIPAFIAPAQNNTAQAEEQHAEKAP
jgi:hypothetical protein